MSLDLNLHSLLVEICVELDLDRERYQKIELAYDDISLFLSEDGFFADVKNRIYPQGSVLLDTTNQPIRYCEYDIDCVNEARLDPSKVSPMAYLESMERRLRRHPIYLNLEMKNRCVRINLPGFHLDILPAIIDPSRSDGSILVPDRKTRDWTESNPLGYGKWFGGRAEQRIRLLKQAAEVIPLPKKTPAKEKEPLKLLVQLTKRHRDIMFIPDDPNAPISIVLTTLAGHFYEGEDYLEDAMTNFLRRLNQEISKSKHPLIVRNPTNENEILSEKWQERPVAYQKFTEWVGAFTFKWQRLLRASGIDEVSQLASEMFGEQIVKNYILKSAHNVGAARSAGLLGTGALGALAVAGTSAKASVKAIPKNTFYGADY